MPRHVSRSLDSTLNWECDLYISHMETTWPISIQKIHDLSCIFHQIERYKHFLLVSMESWEEIATEVCS
jgi:hypothetical protein